MSIDRLPKLDRAILTKKINVAVTEETKKKLEILKDHHGINTPEWIRQIIERELQTIDIE